MFNKKISTFSIALQSAVRSQDFYLEVLGLPKSKNTSSNNSKIYEDNGSSVFGTNEKPETRYFLTNPERPALVLLTSQKNPVMTQQDIFTILKIKSGSILNRTQHRLLGHKLINIHKIQKGKTFQLVWVATDKAFEILNLNRQPRHIIGSDFHAFIVESVNGHFKLLGWQTQCEFQLPDGSFIDLLARRGQETVCIEVGLSPLEKEVHNALKIFSSGLNPNKILHVVQNSKDQKKLEQLLRAEEKLDSHAEKIEITLAGNYI
ncbi:hypothetical protein HY405_00380 [Candidatus Microgenomates bacterium]|nr:hypothetical protein [Candidatus Microgenomates bacterium]